MDEGKSFSAFKRHLCSLCWVNAVRALDENLDIPGGVLSQSGKTFNIIRGVKSDKGRLVGRLSQSSRR